MIIAQPSGSLFHVGFKVIDGVAIAREAFVGQLLESRQEKWPSLLLGSWQDFAVEPFVEFFIPVQEAPVQQSEMKFGVVHFDAATFFECAARRADPESQIPERSGKVRDQGTKLLLHLVISEQK